MTKVRKRPAQPARSARLRALRRKLRLGVYSIDSKKLTEALSRAGALSLN